jgi:hypothetical protein
MVSSVRVIFKARQMLMQLKERFALKIVSRILCLINLHNTFFNTLMSIIIIIIIILSRRDFISVALSIQYSLLSRRDYRSTFQFPPALAGG